ncbi:MAG TPA: efflux transporter outer membrane subunit [Steroidobacteraceae bacterium]|nr:efflux transporter outer membrane subunit [Steroidobacteraceae bacterium]
MPTGYVGAPEGAAAPAEPAELSAWWEQFRDPELQSLITRAFESNLDLRTAASRIREARQQEVIAGAREFPNVNVSALGAAMHSRSNPFGSLGGNGGSDGAANGNAGTGANGSTGAGPGAVGGAESSGASSGTGTGPGSGAGAASTGDTAAESSGASSGGTGGGQTLKLFSAGFDATWELDLFGGTRRAIEAAKAATDAAVWQLRDGQVSLSAEIAVDYLTLCATRTRIRVINESLQRQQQQLEITDARRRFGFVTELDVNQARAQLALTTAQLPSLEAEARALTHALAVLLGQQPDAMANELAKATSIPATPPVMPLGLPSDLLRRRPDIRQAERRLAASTAQVGVAVAALYPSFDLLGAANYAGNSIDGLISPRHFSTVGAGIIRWPIFQAGASRANVQAREEERQQAYLAYQKSVLGALQDAEDSLARLDAEQHRLGSLLDAETAARSTLDIARSQYRNGLVGFINVLSAETTLLDVENELAQSRAALAQSLVSVYKALGGGWRVEPR